ncbi:multidrug efflux MATE transporter BexA [soil metagenome]
MQGNYKDIIKLATPIMLGGVAQNSIAFADTAMLARYGEVELTAVGIVSMWYLLVFMIGFAFTKGTQIFIARRLAERNYEAVGSIFSNSFVILSGIGLVLFFVLRFGSPYLMDWYFENELAKIAGTEYLQTRAYGIIFSFIGSVFLAFYMGVGVLNILIWAMLVMASFNIFMNYVLIFGAFGFPEMGISGAAMASNLAEILVTSIMVVYTLRKQFHKKYFFFKKQVLSRQVSLSITSISVPIVTLTVVGLLAWMVFMYYIEKMGPFDTQVSNLTKSLYMFLGLPAWAFSAASGTIISNLMGQKLHHRVIEAIKNIMVLSFITTFIVALPIVVFPEFIVSNVLDPKLPELVPASVPVIYVMFIALLIYSVSTVLFHSIVSTGSATVSLVIELITIAGYLGFVLWVFSLEENTVAIAWTSEIFYWLFLLLVAYLYFRSGRWKNTTI